MITTYATFVGIFSTVKNNTNPLFLLDNGCQAAIDW